MSILSFLYDLIIEPIVLLYDVIFTLFFTTTFRVGASIIALSVIVNLLVLPLYRRADALQEEERVRMETLRPGVEHIKKVFKGDERFMMLQTYYRQNHYKPYYSLKGSLSLLLEIPFFIAAYNFLSNLSLLNGTPFKSIPDLGQPDGLIHLAGLQINLLPILMTVINIVSGMIYTKGAPLKNKIQLYGMALIFFVLLYNSPSGLVFYWTLNNLFSLGKNIYYKLKKPMLTLGSACFALGCVVMPYIIVKPMLTMKKQLFVILCLTPLFLILPAHLLFQKFGGRLRKRPDGKAYGNADNVLFLTCCVFLTVLTGVLIPSAVIRSSPGEFVNRFDFHNPLRYVGTSFTLAAGTFMIWLSVFYYLSSRKTRRIFSICTAVIAVLAAVNYMFFGRNYGNMSSVLQYDNILNSASLDYLINTVVIVAMTAVIYVLWRKFPVILRSVTVAMSVSVVIMSCMNLFSINSSIRKISKSLDTLKTNEGIELPLDKSGKNVVVIMLDRAIGDLFPFAIEEKPELKQQFAGFTYYPNVISYGYTTLTGSPALFGGYEYTPEKNNERSEETLKEKQTEALTLMPVVFSEEGYQVTVCDPPFAGMSEFVDLNIYNDYPQINRYITKEKFSDENNTKELDEVRNRHFFAYSIMRISPVMLHLTLYNKGAYYHFAPSSIQVCDGLYTAHGGTKNSTAKFIGTYKVLEKLPDMTSITDNGSNTLLLLENDSAHDVIMLQEPAFEPAEQVDNTAYEAEHSTRVSAEGREMSFTTRKQMTHYQCNVASLLKLGQWMDYLRENGVYDNTRIIIVSDHGKNLNYLFGDRITNGAEKIPSTDDQIDFDDILAYKPLLLVKDFNSTKLTTDTTFMTNADTPAIAFEGLIDNPLNPFTGKKIGFEGKNQKEHHIAGSIAWNPSDYSDKETVLKDLTWIGFKGTDTTDLKSWRGIGSSLD